MTTSLEVIIHVATSAEGALQHPLPPDPVPKSVIGQSKVLLQVIARSAYWERDRRLSAACGAANAEERDCAPIPRGKTAVAREQAAERSRTCERRGWGPAHHMVELGGEGVPQIPVLEAVPHPRSKGLRVGRSSASDCREDVRRLRYHCGTGALDDSQAVAQLGH